MPEISSEDYWSSVGGEPQCTEVLLEVSDLVHNRLLFLTHGAMDTLQHDVKHCHCHTDFSGRITSGDRTMT